MKAKINFRIAIFLVIISFIFTGCKAAEGDKNGQGLPKVTEKIDKMASSMGEDNKEKASTRKITDESGRTVEIPSQIKTAYATSQIGMIMLYTLNPGKLAGWGYALSDSDKQFIAPKYFDLPILGVWSGKNGTGNVEEIIRVHPDVIFSVGTIEDSQKELAEKIQEQTGIPVVMLDGPLTKLDKLYKSMGDIIGEEEKAKELGDYCGKTIAEIGSLTAKIPDEKRVKVYYAEGPKGLETDPSGSFHTEVLDFIGGKNVADVKKQGGFGRSAVSLEQLLKWNPEVIIVGYDKDAKEGFFKDIYKTAEWMSISAVKNKKVYAIPNKPFDWFDRPPSVNRIIGVKWLAHLLYPEYVNLNIEEEVKEFYDKFYHKKLTDEEVNELLKEAGGK
ncbi:ABC transporter substrate-binding protein [Acetivibrio cellulolyticus]|uniref:ABC transporter substrate-binding protein n=1 Tax=Acetivibrio cellulolyticus TaxID=35830 RepID=UPI0001E300FB|nr:ABC transporter substrate-binding protein [Acetivibrio cellulolyticus]